MPNQTVDSERVHDQVQQLFSWQAEVRKAAQNALESADEEERLAITEAVLPEARRDVWRVWAIAWLMLAVIGAAFFLSQNTGDPVSRGYPEYALTWLCVVCVGAAIHVCVANRLANRQGAIVAVLDRATDYRLVYTLLAYRVRMAERFGETSPTYLSLTSALERLLPLVTLEHIGDDKAPWRRILSPFLEGPPSNPQLTMEALRLAPAFGDGRTLKSVERLAQQYEWGGAVAIAACMQIRKAAAESEAALQAALERQRQNTTLLRPSDATEEPPSVSLLRPSLRAADDSPDELLRPEHPEPRGGPESTI